MSREQREAYVVDAIRTPTGRRRGGLAHVHAADLGGFILRQIVERNAIPADEYDDVVFGAMNSIGPLAGNVARTCWLAAGLPLTVPGVTIDRMCGSSQQAVHFAAQAVMSGNQDVVIAGGVQTMSQIPIGYAMGAAAPLGMPDPFSGSLGWVARFGGQPVSQFHGASLIADKWGFSREAMEVFSLESHNRALRAQAEGRFDREIMPLENVQRDETPRATSLEKMASLEPIPGFPRLTAGIASQTCDAAAAVLVVSEEAVKRYDLKPRARIHHMSVLGDTRVDQRGRLERGRTGAAGEGTPPDGMLDLVFVADAPQDSAAPTGYMPIHAILPLSMDIPSRPFASAARPTACCSRV